MPPVLTHIRVSFVKPDGVQKSIIYEAAKPQPSSVAIRRLDPKAWSPKLERVTEWDSTHPTLQSKVRSFELYNTSRRSR